MSSDSDKRRDKRLELRLPIKFFKDPTESLPMREGVTHNVSSGGVFFEAPASHVMQDGPVTLRIGVQDKEGDHSPSLTLVGSGAVCRIEPLDPAHVIGPWSKEQADTGIMGVAVQFHTRPTIQLRSLDELLWGDHHEAG